MAFEASLREAVRTLKSYSENRGKRDMIGDFNDQLEHRYVFYMTIGHLRVALNFIMKAGLLGS